MLLLGGKDREKTAELKISLSGALSALKSHSIPQSDGVSSPVASVEPMVNGDMNSSMNGSTIVTVTSANSPDLDSSGASAKHMVQ